MPVVEFFKYSSTSKLGIPHPAAPRSLGNQLVHIVPQVQLLMWRAMPAGIGYPCPSDRQCSSVLGYCHHQQLMMKTHFCPVAYQGNTATVRRPLQQPHNCVLIPCPDTRRPIVQQALQAPHNANLFYPKGTLHTITYVWTFLAGEMPIIRYTMLITWLSHSKGSNLISRPYKLRYNGGGTAIN